MKMVMVVATIIRQIHVVMKETMVLLPEASEDQEVLWDQGDHKVSQVHRARQVMRLHWELHLLQGEPDRYLHI